MNALTTLLCDVLLSYRCSMYVYGGNKDHPQDTPTQSVTERHFLLNIYYNTNCTGIWDQVERSAPDIAYHIGCLIKNKQFKVY